MRQVAAGWVTFGLDGATVEASTEAERAIGASLAEWKTRGWTLIDAQHRKAIPREVPLEVLRTGQPEWKAIGNVHADRINWVTNLYVRRQDGAGGVMLLSEGLSPGGLAGRCARCEFGHEHTVICACESRLCWSCARLHPCPGRPLVAQRRARRIAPAAPAPEIIPPQDLPERLMLVSRLLASLSVSLAALAGAHAQGLGAAAVPLPRPQQTRPGSGRVVRAEQRFRVPGERKG